MFGSKRQAANPEEVATVIGKQTQVKGNLTADSSIRVDGTIDGDLTATGHVIVGEGGVVKASVKASNVTVAGTVTGNLDVEERLELLPTAKITGDIVAGVLVVGEGAAFSGNCTMRSEKAVYQEPKLGLVKTQ